MRFIIIENNIQRIRMYEDAGIESIMIDLETLGKAERQRGLPSVQSRHTLEDVSLARRELKRAELLVRINPWHAGSRVEIEAVLDRGAERIMLPMFTSIEEVEKTKAAIHKRAALSLLVETPLAVGFLPELLQRGGFADIYIGLNDLSLALKLHFMFEPLASGLVDEIAAHCRAARFQFGFGGVGTAERGDIPGKEVMQQHARLGSTQVILSQLFRKHIENNPTQLGKELERLRAAYKEALSFSAERTAVVKDQFARKVAQVVERRKEVSGTGGELC